MHAPKPTDTCWCACGKSHAPCDTDTSAADAVLCSQECRAVQVLIGRQHKVHSGGVTLQVFTLVLTRSRHAPRQLGKLQLQNGALAVLRGACGVEQVQPAAVRDGRAARQHGHAGPRQLSPELPPQAHAACRDAVLPCQGQPDELPGIRQAVRARGSQEVRRRGGEPRLVEAGAVDLPHRRVGAVQHHIREALRRQQPHLQASPAPVPSRLGRASSAQRHVDPRAAPGHTVRHAWRRGIHLDAAGDAHSP